MGVLQFDGVDDRLHWATLAAALANVGDGAWTLAVLTKRSATQGAFHGLSYLLSSTGAGVARAGLSFINTNVAAVDVAGGSVFPTALTSSTSPYLLVVSKDAGTVISRLAWKLGSGGAWTHENADVALADQIAATMLEIATWQALDVYPGHIGVVGWWEGAMSDANKEALDNNWRTSDLWNSAHGQPAFLAELNIAGASVVDLAENATVLTATGTTLDAAETLDSWNFNGKGAVLVPRPRVSLRPAPFAPGGARR